MIVKPIALAQLIRGMPERYDGFLRQLGYEPDSYPAQRQITLGDIAMWSSGSSALRLADYHFPQIEPRDLLRALLPMMRRATIHSPNAAIYMDKIHALEGLLAGNSDYDPSLYKVAEAASDYSLFYAMRNLDVVVACTQRTLFAQKAAGLLSFRAALGAKWAIAAAEGISMSGIVDEVLEAQSFAKESSRQTSDVVALFGVTHDWPQLEYK